MTILNLPSIIELPQITTSNLRELQWSIDWHARCYANAAEQSEIAWKMYQDAIDNGKTREEKDELYKLAAILEANKCAAWHRWQDAKSQYLALLN